MEIEIEANIVVTESAIDPDAISKPISKLTKRRAKYNSRYVGGLHSLSMTDKAAWVRNTAGPLRIIEADTGREEIWFFDNNDTPTYISINSAGLLESHKKYNTHMPAIHYTRSDTPISNKKISLTVTSTSGTITRSYRILKELQLLMLAPGYSKSRIPRSTI